MTFLEILQNHEELSKRKDKTLKIYKEIVDDFKNINNKKVVIFTVGSIGREEVGSNSDLDLFYISDDNISRLEEYEIFAKSISINNELGFEKFSNDGEFLKIHSLKKIQKTIGAPKDDEENLFTTRMLLLLESKYVYNEKKYENIIKEIVKVYFRDFKEGKNFKPLFILNDLLRFWRTLCLNYENTRHDEDRPWRKKNINLKYSRMITVFGTILYILTVDQLTEEKIIEISKCTPLERFAKALDYLNDEKYKEEFENFLDYYSKFLLAKENENIEKNKELIKELDNNAIKFSDFIYEILTSDKIDREYRKYLVV